MGGPVVVVDDDPQWPAQFERLRAIWAAALGGVAVRIEHAYCEAKTEFVESLLARALA